MKTREFVTCLGCNSATLKSFINPVRQLCKVCEARELAAEDYSAVISTLALNSSVVLPFGRLHSRCVDWGAS